MLTDTFFAVPFLGAVRKLDFVLDNYEDGHIKFTAILGIVANRHYANNIEYSLNTANLRN